MVGIGIGAKVGVNKDVSECCMQRWKLFVRIYSFIFVLLPCFSIVIACNCHCANHML